MTQPPRRKTKSESDIRIEYLRSLQSVRARCHELLMMAKEKKLHHFTLHEDKISIVVDEVLALIKAYPNGVDSVPFHSRWRHFEPGTQNKNRVQDMCATWECDEKEKARRLIDLVLVSVLLDAGAGPSWKFTEPVTNEVFTRSEGLGIASFNMFLSGAFSSDPNKPHQVDAEALIHLPSNAIESAFQVVSQFQVFIVFF